MTTNPGAEKEILFAIEIRDDRMFHESEELNRFIASLPNTIRIYAVIHAAFNTVKVYCATRNYAQVSALTHKTGYKISLVDSIKS